MLNVVRIKKAAFYAYHGAMKEEQSIGGNFEADVDMYFDFSEAAKNDDLSTNLPTYVLRLPQKEQIAY